MKRLTSLKSIAAAALVLGAFGAASAAHAGGNVTFSVGVAPSGFVQPWSVYPQQPVYVQPQTIYVQPVPLYGNVQPVYVQPYARGPYGDRDGDGIANRFDRHDNRHGGRHIGAYGPNGDFDRDGVANRFDRAPNNPNFR